MATAQHWPLPESEYIADYNNQREEQPCMKQYRDTQKNGSIHVAILDPPLRGLKTVPQLLYMGNNKQPDKTFAPHPSIQFFVDKPSGSEDLQLNRLRLTDAIDGNLDGLRPVAELWLSGSTKTHIRLRVLDNPDHGEPIPSCRATKEKESKELAEIAQKVATIIQRSMPSVQLDGVEVRQWRLPNGDKVKFEDLILLELVHVTIGSWQPVLAYFR